MTWIDALEIASPRPAIRTDADGSTWVVYADGSMDRVDRRGRYRRVRDPRPERWGDWQPEERS